MIHNKVNFKIDARPERDPVELTDYLYNARVPGGPVNNVFKIILTIFSFFMWVQLLHWQWIRQYLGLSVCEYIKIDVSGNYNLHQFLI